MTTRQELLTQWQERLADAEHACAAAPSWSERIRVKLYRFLLAMYGHTQWPGPKDDVDNSQLRAATGKLMVAEHEQEAAGAQAVLVGKEPRTRAEILKGLQNLKGLGEELAPAGPLTDGLLPDSPVAVASFKKEPAASAAIRKLQRAGFAPAITQRGGLYQIFVGAAHSAEATAWLRSESPPRRSVPEIVRISRPPQFMLLVGAIFFGTLSGLLAGMLVQLVFVDLSHLSLREIPTDQDVLPLAVFAVVSVVIAVLLFRGWTNSKPAQVTVFSFPPFVTPLLCCGVVCGFFGLVLTAYLTLFLWFSPNPSFTEARLVPDLPSVNIVAVAAIWLDLMAIQLLWVWWRWQRRPIARESAPAAHTRSESR